MKRVDTEGSEATWEQSEISLFMEYSEIYYVSEICYIPMR